MTTHRFCNQKISIQPSAQVSLKGQKRKKMKQVIKLSIVSMAKQWIKVLLSWMSSLPWFSNMYIRTLSLVTSRISAKKRKTHKNY